MPLRERRREQLRGQLTDEATRLFLDRGFDAVRVSDVARVCGVTEKTVYAYFPTKESLLADRWVPLIADFGHALAGRSTPVLEVAEHVLRRELDELLAQPAVGGGSPRAELARFTDLVRGTPALVAHERSQLEHLTAVVASTVGPRGGGRSDPPTAATWITASAVAALFALFYRSLHRHVHDLVHDEDPDRLRAAVLHDVREAADVLRHGL